MSEIAHSGEDVVVPMGEDDCSVVKIDGTYLIQSCDAISSKPLTSKYGKRNPKGVANYLVQANLSDILSSGAIPQGIHTLFEFPSSYSYDKYKEFVKGFSEITNHYNISWLGGDLKETEGTRLAAMIQGTVSNKEQIRTRAGAEVGDVIIVTRNIGTINAATFFIDKYDSISKKDEEYLYEKTKMPEAPYEESIYMTKNNIGNGGLDITDGLGMDLKKLADKSDVGLRIKESKIPMDDQVVKIINQYTEYHPSAFAFTLGGDWQSVVTMSPDDWNEIKDPVNNVGKATKIGRVIEKSRGLEYITDEGARTTLPTGGKEIFTGSTSFSSKTEELLNKYQQTTKKA
ncbi:AIR synthase related protein [Halorubrum vacuolatum]|nr:AIR synthase related protein [Halorubrum vacuolatum]